MSLLVFQCASVSVLGQSATATQIGVGLLVLVALMSAVLLGIKLKKEIVPGPQKDGPPVPYPVTMVDKFATKEELQEVKDDLKLVERTQAESERRILEAIEHSCDKIAEKVDKIGTAGANGRRDLHEKNRQLGERVSSVETEVRVFKRQFE